jgi:hypothetical protein
MEGRQAILKSMGGDQLPSDAPPNTASIGETSQSSDGLFLKSGCVIASILAGAIDDVMGNRLAPCFVLRPDGEIGDGSLKGLVHGG